MDIRGRSYFYYPTTTVIVDDCEEFLGELSLTLNTRGDKLVKTFSDPKQALSYLKSKNSIYKDYQKYLENVNTIETDVDDKDKISKINFSNIHDLQYDKDRHSEISVIIADYFMPQINGIEFFKQIKDFSAKKILLTGNSDYKLAVDAFNSGLIDKFLIKETTGTGEGLFECIKNFKEKYFQDFSEILLQIFDKGVKRASQYNFIFNDWCSKNEILEYYQCDSNGSCLGFNTKKGTHWLLVCSEKETLEYISIAEDAEKNFPLLKDLKSNKKLLFFFTEKDRETSPSKWIKYIHEIHGNFAVNNEKYFYSFLTGKQIRD